MNLFIIGIITFSFCGWLFYMWWLWKSPKQFAGAPDISRNVLPAYLKQTPEVLPDMQAISLSYMSRMDGLDGIEDYSNEPMLSDTEADAPLELPGEDGIPDETEARHLLSID